MSGPIDNILPLLKGRKPAGPGKWVALCPAHDDREPSLSLAEGVDGKLLVNCHAGCSFANVMAALGMKEQDAFADGKPLPPPPPTKVTLENLAERTGLAVDYLRSLGLTQRNGHVEVPYRDVAGETIYSKKRVVLDGGGKYRYPTGSKLTPYGLWRLEDAKRVKAVALVEGESDCWTLWRFGIPALGIPGAANFRCLHAEHLAGLERIYVVKENDQAGTEFARAISLYLIELGFRGAVRVVQLPPEVKDPNDLYRQLGDERFLGRWKELCAKARPAGELPIDDRVVSLDKVVMRQPVWSWYPYLIAGEFNLLAGDRGEGKSVLFAELCAIVSSGRPFPGGDKRKPENVLVFAGEDDIESVLAPRIAECGGDLSRVKAYDLREHDWSLADQNSIDELRMLVARYSPALIGLDPIISFVGSGMKMKEQNHVRGILNPLAKILRECGATGLAVAHMRKGGSGKALDGVMGSVDFTALPRSVIQFYRDPNDDNSRVLVHSKHNLSSRGDSLKVTITGPDRGAAHIEWGGVARFTADELAGLAAEKSHDTTGSESKVSEAERFLLDELSGGEVLAGDLMRAARENGHRDRTIHRAREKLGIKVGRKGGRGGKYYWSLPEKVDEVPT